MNVSINTYKAVGSLFTITILQLECSFDLPLKYQFWQILIFCFGFFNMLLLIKLAIGTGMIGFTVVLHAFVCDWVFRFIERYSRPFVGTFGRYWTIPTLITAVFVIGSALMVDIWAWTLLFLWLEPVALPTVDDALYFTTSTFTTVGYGDIVLTDEWRLLAGTTAINGMILFGWSTAFIFEIMAKLYKSGRIYGKRSDE